MDTLSLTNEARIYNGEKTIFLTSGAGKTGQPLVKESHQVAKVLEFQLQHLISFRMNWLDHLRVQRTLNSLLQHHSSEASILWFSALFIVQLSHP